MKKSILLTVAILGMVFCNAHSQVTLDRIQMSEGKGAMTSGLDFVVSFSGQKGRIYAIQANNERVNLRIGKQYGDFSVLFTTGAFRNVPWAGPMAYYSVKGFTFFTWSGIGFGTDKELTDPGFQPQFFFTYNSVEYAFGNNAVSYAFQFFTTNPMDHFFVYRRVFPLNKAFKEGSLLQAGKFFVETTYDCRQDLAMFVVGYAHSFTK